MARLMNLPSSRVKVCEEAEPLTHLRLLGSLRGRRGGRSPDPALLLALPVLLLRLAPLVRRLGKSHFIQEWPELSS